MLLSAQRVEYMRDVDDRAIDFVAAFTSTDHQPPLPASDGDELLERGFWISTDRTPTIVSIICEEQSIIFLSDCRSIA